MRGILATLQYFDMFDHPLTLMELFRYRYSLDTAEGRGAPSSDAVRTVLAGKDALVSSALASSGRTPLPSAAPSLSDITTDIMRLGIPSMNGFYFLPGREEIVATRQRRHRMSEAKFRRARRAARLMSLLPSVRLIAVCNSLALTNADRDSDIDLFVVARPGTLWSTRLLVVGALALLGLRPSARTDADKICMSFFVSENALDLRPLMRQPDDTYLRYWVASLVPLHDAGGVMERFLTANTWVADHVPGALVPRRAAGSAILSPLPMSGLLRALDPVARSLQRAMFPARIRDASPEDTAVVVNNDVLKFHVDDRRDEFERRFRERIAVAELAESKIKEHATV